MLDISFAELCIVLLVAIIFVSPKNFPSLFKSMARLYKKSKNSLLDIKEEIEREDKFQELKKIENEFKILKNHARKKYKKNLKKQTLFLSHFKDLRTVLIRSSIIFFVIFISLFPFSNEIYQFFANPLSNQLSLVNGSLISTKLTATFVAPFKITLFVALIISLPLIFSQIWKFVGPGLYKKEKGFILSASIFSFGLFVISLVFVYLVLFPNIFRFFIVTAPGNVDLMIDISQYLEMILALFFAFGIAFQIPIMLIVIVKFKLLSINKIKSNRAYIYVAAFVFAAVFTPPDVISQILACNPSYIFI